jgi:exosome complex exonuclease RRP6
VVDVLRVKPHVSAAFKDIFQDPAIVKIFHGCDSDLQLLASDLDIMVINVFDTARAYQQIQKLP